MCGISGIFDPHGPLPENALAACRRMNAAMIHRGPDEEGFHQHDGLIFGHRRLSIIDLASGQQPMHSGCGNYSIVFNGEIYNFRELRDELRSLGHSFRTRSDTEVILEGYKAWGRKILERLQGMFAFVLYDKQRRLILGARDPIGKKPLYFARQGQALHFASELGALCAGGSVSKCISEEALGLYFCLGFIPAPYCIYSGAEKLAAGHAFEYSRGKLEQWQYWDIGLDAVSDLDETEGLQKLDALLRDAVNKRLLSEVPLGAFLSGGVDSNLVVSAMAKISNTPVKTFTAGSGARSKLPGVRDERDLAAAAAAHYGTVHTELDLSMHTGSLLPELDRKSTRLNSSHSDRSRMPSSA